MKNYTPGQARTRRLVFFSVGLFSLILVASSILFLLWGTSFLIQGRVTDWNDTGFPQVGPFSRTFSQVAMGVLAVGTAVAWAGWFPEETVALRSKVSSCLSRHFLTISVALTVVTLIVLLLTRLSYCSSSPTREMSTLTCFKHTLSPAVACGTSYRRWSAFSHSIGSLKRMGSGSASIPQAGQDF